ncbi:phage tail tape measure protein [Methylomonas montana]|uniref:phage tail tape measure protein n=1 Tax=Methylomonas montana TaxID=3058963 RepID=UPI002658F084|nr:phage tail tape measure protein [Methylomonas montana]WKJ92433.1 phage tail tape measure protein [Methylomonas montana]
MSKDFDLKAVISMVDRMSPGLKHITKNLNLLHRQLRVVGNGAPMLGAGFVAAMAVPAKAFMDLENSAVYLQNTLMDKNGNIPAVFQKISEEAIKLGTQLPGTTADFNAMSSTLKAFGVNADSIANGVLRATAYLGVVGKDINVTYDSAAESMGKLSRAFNIADSDMVPFSDSIQRVLFNGTKLDELQYAMSRVSGPLKVAGEEGLKAANQMLPLVSVFTSTGISGEEAGTGIREIINQATKLNKFSGIPKLIADLDKINHLPSKLRFAKLENLFGKEHASKAALITLESYNRQVQAMANQGSLLDKIANSAGTLTNKVETAGGTWSNFMAKFGSQYAPELKAAADSVNRISENLTGFIDQNGPAVMTAAKMAGAFVGLKVAAWGLAGGIGAITAAMKLNPLMLLAQAAIVAAPLIIDNWDSIVNRLKEGFSRIKDFFQPLIDMFKYIGNWVSNNSMLKLVGSVPMFLGKSVASLLPDFSGVQLPSGEGMRAPGYQKNIVGSVKGGVDVNVRFDNSPATMRVAPSKTRGPVRSNVDVGYGFTHAMYLGMP